MRSLSQAVIEAKDREFNIPIWLYEISLDDVTTKYVTENVEAVVYQGNTYDPFPITHNEITQDSSGEIHAIEVSMSMVSYELRNIMHTYSLRGREVKIKQVLAETLSDPIPLEDEMYYISDYSFGNEAAVFTLVSAFDVLDRTTPARTISRELFPYIPRSRLYVR